VYVPVDSAPVEVPVLEVATVPPQPSLPVPPPAVQLVALLLRHASELALPACSDDGVAVKLEMLAGGGVAVTMTLTDAGAPVPPAPVHVNV
jgi:hypothetical protein